MTIDQLRQVFAFRELHDERDRVARAFETVDVRAAVTLTDRIMASQGLLDALAPAVGALLRGREVAA